MPQLNGNLTKKFFLRNPTDPKDQWAATELSRLAMDIDSRFSMVSKLLSSIDPNGDSTDDTEFKTFKSQVTIAVSDLNTRISLIDQKLGAINTSEIAEVKASLAAIQRQLISINDSLNSVLYNAIQKVKTIEVTGISHASWNILEFDIPFDTDYYKGYEINPSVQIECQAVFPPEIVFSGTFYDSILRIYKIRFLNTSGSLVVWPDCNIIFTYTLNDSPPDIIT